MFIRKKFWSHNNFSPIRVDLQWKVGKKIDDGKIHKMCATYTTVKNKIGHFLITKLF